MPDRTVEISTPYRRSADLTKSIYADIRSTWGADIEILLDVEQDKGVAELLPYVGLALGYASKVVLDLAIEEAAKRVADLVRRLGRGDRGPGEPSYEVRVTGGEHRLVYLYDEATSADERAARAMLDHNLVPDAEPGTRLRWDADASRWYPLARR